MGLLAKAKEMRIEKKTISVGVPVPEPRKAKAPAERIPAPKSSVPDAPEEIPGLDLQDIASGSQAADGGMKEEELQLPEPPAPIEEHEEPKPARKKFSLFGFLKKKEEVPAMQPTPVSGEIREEEFAPPEEPKLELGDEEKELEKELEETKSNVKPSPDPDASVNP